MLSASLEPERKTNTLAADEFKDTARWVGRQVARESPGTCIGSRLGGLVPRARVLLSAHLLWETGASVRTSGTQRGWEHPSSSGSTLQMPPRSMLGCQAQQLHVCKARGPEESRAILSVRVMTHRHPPASPNGWSHSHTLPQHLAASDGPHRRRQHCLAGRESTDSFPERHGWGKRGFSLLRIRGRAHRGSRCCGAVG